MEKIKVAILSGYPLFLIEKEIGKENLPKLGIASWTVNLCESLSKLDDIELHLITETKIVDKNYHFKKNGIYFHVIKGQKRLNAYTFFFFNVLRIKKALKKINPDILHAHHTDKYALAALKYNEDKTLITVHGIYKEVYKKLKKKPFSGMYFLKLVEKYSFKKAKHIISINPYVLNKCDSLLRNNTNIFSIENPVDYKYFVDQKRTKLKNKILLVAVIQERKNILSAIKVIKYIKVYEDNVILDIVGPIADKNYFAYLEKYILDNKLKSNVKFKGFMDSKVISKSMEIYKMLILTSIEETAPTVISEAMAAGLPVVSTNVGGVKYMIDDGKTGFVVPINDEKTMSNRIIQLLSDKNLRDRMGREAKKQAIRRFHPDIVAKKTREAYMKILL